MKQDKSCHQLISTNINTLQVLLKQSHSGKFTKTLQKRTERKKCWNITVSPVKIVIVALPSSAYMNT